MSWNQGAEKLYGYSAAEILGRTPESLIPPDRLHELTEARARLMRGEGVQRFETKRLRKDGGLVDVYVTLSPIYNAAGALVGASSIAHDITEEKRAERTLRLTQFSIDRAKEAIMAKITENEAARAALAVTKGSRLGAVSASNLPDLDQARARVAARSGSN